MWWDVNNMLSLSEITNNLFFFLEILVEPRFFKAIFLKLGIVVEYFQGELNNLFI